MKKRDQKKIAGFLDEKNDGFAFRVVVSFFAHNAHGEPILVISSSRSSHRVQVVEGSVQDAPISIIFSGAPTCTKVAPQNF